MAEYADREHYIPLRKGDLVDLLCSEKGMPATERAPLRQFCTLISAVFHFEYLERLEKLKDAFAPFDPDSQTKPLKPLRPDEREARLDALFAEFQSLMERANFEELTEDDVKAATEGGASDWGINMEVDFGVFERLVLFHRGDGLVLRTKKHPIFFWKKVEKKVDCYGRLVLMMKLRPHKRLGVDLDTSGVFLKLFKDIPKLDLEMVLPGTRIQMPRAQKGKMGVSLIGTLGFGIYKVSADLLALFGKVVAGGLAAASHMAMGPFVVLGGYGYKQYAGYQLTKQKYSKMLTESLYYQNLDNNAGVMTRLLDEAEEQECREAMLAYYCLWRFAPPQGWTAEQLDDYVEMWLEGPPINLKVDFEIGDALDKVERLGVVEKQGSFYKAVPLATALEKLDYRWDNYFQYNKS